MKTKIKNIVAIVFMGFMIAVFIIFWCWAFSNTEKTTDTETTTETETEPELYGVVDHEFVEIVAWDEKDLTGIAYDSDTKIIYMFTTVDGARLYTPYYVINEDNEPVIGVYDDTEEEYEFEDTVGEIGGEVE